MSTETIREKHLRVTDVIGAFSGIDRIPAEIRESAAERGSLVHACIESKLNGHEIHIVPDETRPFLDSFYLFWTSHSHLYKDKLIETEKRLYCDQYFFTGCIDLIVSDNDNRTYILDWKTSASPHKSWRLQAAAYKYLCEVNDYNNVDSLTFVRLDRQGGRPTLHKYENYLEDFEMFLSCLNIYRFFGIDKRKEWI